MGDIDISSVTTSQVEIAFFDLDGTLTETDTDWIWALWRRYQSRAGFLEFLWLRRIFRMFRKGRMNPREYLAYHFVRAHSLGEERYRHSAERFFRIHSGSLVRHEMIPVLDYYRSRQITIVLITAQNRIMAEPFAEFFRIPVLIANEYEVKPNGRFGNLKSPVCFGSGKMQIARTFAADRGISLDQCAFYSDSSHDLPLLSAVSYPVAVAPNRKLRDHAEERHWPIIANGVEIA